MPLFILGFILLICILAFAIFKYVHSGEEIDPRPVRERYPKAFPKPPGSEDQDKDADAASSDNDEPIYAESYVETDSLRGDLEYMFRNIKEDLAERAKEKGLTIDNISDKINDTLNRINDPGPKDASDNEKDDKTIIFPTDNVEAEKQKRNIH